MRGAVVSWLVRLTLERLYSRFEPWPDTLCRGSTMQTLSFYLRGKLVGFLQSVTEDLNFGLTL